jgi:hypothetical protein
VPSSENGEGAGFGLKLQTPDKGTSMQLASLSLHLHAGFVISSKECVE